MHSQGTSSSAPKGSDVPIVIVDPRFCVSNPVEIAIVRKVMKLTAGNFVITDVNGNMLFKVKDRVFGLHDKRTLLDSSGSPVLTMKDKIMSMHGRWQVFRGGSTEPGDLMYTVKKSSMVQLTTKLDVFLSHNKEEIRSDFRVKGSRTECSCIVYAVIAQMLNKETLQSFVWGKDKFSVTVYPNVDYAFIASLIVILDDINNPTTRFSFNPNI